MRILGIDYGDKNIGLAVSDLLGITAQGMGFYRRRGGPEDLAYFKSLVEEYAIGRIVVGLPLRMDGTRGSRAEKTRDFADRATSRCASTSVAPGDDRGACPPARCWSRSAFASATRTSSSSMFPGPRRASTPRNSLLLGRSRPG